MTADWISLSLIPLKSATTGVLLLLAALLARSRGVRGLAGAFLMLSLACYVVVTAFSGPEARAAALLPLRMGAATLPFWFYLFSRALFADDYRPSPWLALLPLGQSALAVLMRHFRLAGVFDLADALLLFQQALALALFVAALALVYHGDRADLIEPRRRLRRRFIGIVGGYALLVLVMEMYLRGQCPPALFEWLNSVGIFVLVAGVAFAALRIDARAIDVAPARITPVPPPTPEEAALETQLMRAMREDRLYREEALTIRRLAARLDVQEYRLRRLINARLGFRNFNEFLNRQRIDEALERLADPARKDEPIVRLAMDLGYGSLATFNRAFRMQTGTTPVALRRAALADASEARDVKS